MKPMKQEKPFRRVSAAEAQALLKSEKISVLDTRDPASFARERIEGAALLGSANLDAVIRAAPKAQPVLIYCSRGNASQVYAQTFVDFGFREVYDLIGGFDAWRAHLSSAITAASNTHQPSATLHAWLAEHGFPTDDLVATIGNRTTPLMHAARLGAHAIAAELVECGAALDATNHDGNNALWLTCFSGNLELIDLLIARGIDLNRQNDNGATCLMYAASAGKTEVVARLLAAGADVRLKSLDDFSALDMAANLECLMLLRRTEKQTREREDAFSDVGC
jgi:thiosulfate/3-mercaptopyruvate sulfurtransferase